MFLNPATGVIAGNPSVYGTFPITVSVTDAVATQPVSQMYNLVIVPTPPTVSTTALPGAVAGIAYSQQLLYAGGANGATVTWALATGSLPAGLSLSSAGVISGSATNASAGATYSFTVTVTVGAQTSVPASLSIVVPALPAVTTKTLPSGNVTIPYSQQLAYSGGAGGTVSWAVTAARCLFLPVLR